MRGNRSGQRDKVRRAREVVKAALGDAARRDYPSQPPLKDAALPNQAEPINSRTESVLVLTVKEAATRLGIGTVEVEAMVKRGAVKSVVAGWTTMVLASEVERLLAVGID